MSPFRTILDLFLKGSGHATRARILRKAGGSFQPMSTEEFVRRALRVAGALEASGVKPGDRVAILAYNSPEWAIVDYAILLRGAVSVSIYSTLPADQVEFILRDSGASLVFVENELQWKKIGARKAVSFHPVPGIPSLEEFMAAGTAMSFEGVKALAAERSPESLATLIYTSGTTGVPKGVMLSHGNIASNVAGSCEIIGFRSDDLGLSFLPLAHSFQRVVDYGLYQSGAAIAYAESVDAVPQNIAEVRPTILAAVPRVYEKFHAKILDSVRKQSPRAQRIFHWAIAVGGLEAELRRRGRAVPAGLKVRFWLARALVLGKLHGRLGGRLRLFLSGGAPLARELADFFWAAGFSVLEGYGLTETSPVISCNRPEATKLGTVGQVIRDVDVKIAEDGEILCRGPNVMQGYYNRPDETAEVLKGGWFSTGDIGELDAEGFLRITDRKKDLLKTSGGKYIAPQPIENQLKLQPGVANAVVLGDRRKFAAALLTPQPGATREQLQAALDRVNLGLAQHEKLKKFALIDREFTIEGGELTPTLKVKRRVVEKKYADVIEKLYADE